MLSFKLERKVKFMYKFCYCVYLTWMSITTFWCHVSFMMESVSRPFVQSTVIMIHLHTSLMNHGIQSMATMSVLNFNEATAHDLFVQHLEAQRHFLRGWFYQITFPINSSVLSGKNLDRIQETFKSL